MKRPRGANTVPSDDPALREGTRAWDDRLEEAKVGRRRSFISSMIFAGFGAAGFAYGIKKDAEAGQPIIRFVETCRAQLINVFSPTDTPQNLSAEQVAEKLKEWVRGAREVSLDGIHMRRGIWNTYWMTEASSQAEGRLREHHALSNPIERAKTETVVLEAHTAFPDGGADSRTWRQEWDEVTTGRDGRVLSVARWRMVLTYTVKRQTDPDEIRKNWSGIFVNSFSWERAGPGSPVVVTQGAPR